MWYNGIRWDCKSWDFSSNLDEALVYSAEVYSPYVSSLEISFDCGGGAERFKPKTVLEAISPPPNVTGEPHLGHVLNLCLQRAYSVGSCERSQLTKWTFGLDHAGTAAKCVLIRRYGSVSVQRFWDWKKRIAKTFLVQLECLLSFKPLERIRFTLDEPFKAAVAYAFVKLWKRKAVTPRRRLVAWDESVKCLVSNLETFRRTEYVKQTSWKFILKHGVNLIWCNGWVLTNYICANRPSTETLVLAVVLGISYLCNCKLSSAKLRDAASAAAVSVLVNAKEDAEGFCVLKSTQNQKCISLLMCIMCASETQDVDMLKTRICRREIKMCYVLYSQKTKWPITPKVSLQWFVKLTALESACNRLAGLLIWPHKWQHTTESWLDNLGLWCVSRSMVWGHRLPVWRIGKRFVVRDTYLKALYYWVLRDGVFEHSADSMMCSLKRDSLVLDTWFSSALWRLSCLGWPHKTSQLRSRYGLGTVFTGFDILFFWIIKMVLMSSWLMKSKLPFKNVVVHPIICDSEGAKMSKTKANVISPRVIVNAYGSNAARVFMASVKLRSQQFKMNVNSLISSRNIITKLWNLSFAADGNKTENSVCRRTVCRLALFDVYNKLMRAELRLRNFNFDNYNLELVEVVKRGLNRLAEIRNTSCKCIRDLARCVWNFYFPLPFSRFRMHKMHTRFSEAAKLYSSLSKLLTSKVYIVTNCVRLFRQSSSLAQDFAITNIYYVSNLRISNRLEVYLWNNSFFVRPSVPSLSYNSASIYLSRGRLLRWVIREV
ncbi:MAG: class I tRNA ligase family protein [Candidatus Hodgkinia cicadicola]